MYCQRRRTQIRLAQRAYRQRKETTIASLKQHNTQLQDIIEKMNKRFLNFNETAIKAGLLRTNPALGQELKSLTEFFVTLAKAAETEDDHEAQEAEDENGRIPFDVATEWHNAATVARSSIATEQSRPTSPPIGQHTDIGWGYSTSITDPTNVKSTNEPQDQEQSSLGSFFPLFRHSAQGTAKQNALVRSRAMTVGEIFDQQRSQPDQQLPFGMMDLAPWSRQNNISHQEPDIFSVNIPSTSITPTNHRLPTPPLIPALSDPSTIISIPKTVKPTWTYSYDETTFARRLTRAALETGFHLLSNANQRPAALNYVFKLSLPYLTLDGLRERFKVLLSRGTDEDLDFWETPFIHLGGAGTHYPRKDPQGNVIPLPNSWHVKSIGPMHPKLIRAENTVDPSRSHDLQVDLTGFEGEWFDAHDVQGYLEEEKGCHINPRDAFAEVVIEVDDDAEETRMNSIIHSRTSTLNLDFSSLNRASSTSTSASPAPGLSNSGSTVDSTSTKTTPDTNTDNVNIEALFAPNETFGLDMSVSNPTSMSTTAHTSSSSLTTTSTSASIPFTYKYDSTLFEEPLGLDLAPSFNNAFSYDFDAFSSDAFGDSSAMDMPLGLDMMGAGADFDTGIPIVKQKRRKAAWVDVSKLVDGMSLSVQV